MTAAKPASAKAAEARPRARGRRDGARRTAIVRRATEIFSAKGFAQTTIEDIADAVGVTREAIYYYFSDKAEILVEIIKPESENLLRGLERIAALEISPRDKLVMAIESHMMRFNPNYLEMAVAVREINGTSRDPRITALRQVWRRYTRLWIRLVEDGRRAGCIAADLDSRLVAFAVLGMLNSASGWFDPGRGSIDDLTSVFARIVTAGVFGRDAPSGDAE